MKGRREVFVMPSKPARSCRQPYCPYLTNDRSGYCEQHRQQATRQYDHERGTAVERGYGASWQRYRREYLTEYPLCVQCLTENRTIVATVVDHIKPHRGDWALFWDAKNHQALCKHHHDVKTAGVDGGFGNRG